MKVWIAQVVYDDEGEEILGVASTPDQGKRMCPVGCAWVEGPAGRSHYGEDLDAVAGHYYRLESWLVDE